MSLPFVLLSFPLTLLQLSFFLSRSSVSLHNVFIFDSVWLSFCHFLSPYVSWLLTGSPSLPSSLMSLHILLSLSPSCSLLPAASHSPSHSLSPPLPPSPVSFSPPLSAFSFPPALLISPLLFLYLSFSVFFPLPLTFTRLSPLPCFSPSLPLFFSALAFPPSVLSLCFCFLILPFLSFSFFPYLHLNVCVCV